MIGLKGGPKRVKRRDESGQTLIMFALGLAVLLGMAAMTIDVGLAYVARRDMQNAADAAALAGADVMLEGQSSVLAANAARDLALQNGYDNAAADVTVDINIPPKSGPHIGDWDFVEVIIKQPIDAVLAPAVGKTSFDISARAVAGIDKTPKPYSIITLSETACQSMQFNGQVNLIIADAGTLTNSECTANAFSTDGAVTVATAANHVVGGWNMTGKSFDVSLPPSRAGHFDDPLIGVPVPTPTSAPVQTCPTFQGQAGPVTLEPGVYDCPTFKPAGSNWKLEFLEGDYLITGGIAIRGGGNVTFGSGLYFLQGEGLEIAGNGVVTGDGVTFYIDEGEVTLTGTSDTQLTAPTSGPYEGVVIFQNRTLTTTVKMSGDAIAGGWGAVYAAGAQIHLVGNTGSTFHQFISDTFLMDGNSSITVDYFSGFSVPVPVMSLVE